MPFALKRLLNAAVLRAVFFVAALFIVIPAASLAWGAAGVTEIKHWSNPNYTRIVISLDKKAAFTSRLLKQDPSINKDWRRLYIDIDNAAASPKLQKSVPINDGLLKMVRAAQFDKSTVRVVLDIESIMDYKVFPLSDPFRIIIDVTGEKAAAQEKEAAPEPPAPPQAAAAPDTKSPAPALTLTQQLGLKVKKIVIDPGHGGHDPGAIGRGGLKEKDVTLRLARMLKEKLSTKLKSKIIMTRETDVFIPLEERTAIANSQDADLFVSIHINASPKRNASGVETYMLNVSRDREAMRVAARENATSRRSVSDLEFILNDLIKSAKTNDSVRLASAVHDKLVQRLKVKYNGVRSNGVKGAPFYVLVGTKMPSILIEASFISNPEEEKRLRDEAYLKEIIEGITTGLLDYINGAGAV